MTSLLDAAGSTQAPEPKSRYISSKTLQVGEGVVLEVGSTEMRTSGFPRTRKDGTSYTPQYLEVAGTITETTAEHFDVGESAVLACSPVDLEALIANVNPQPGDTVAVVLKGLEGMRQFWGGVVRRKGAKDPDAPPATDTAPPAEDWGASPPATSDSDVPPPDDSDAPPEEAAS